MQMNLPLVTESVTVPFTSVMAPSVYAISLTTQKTLELKGRLTNMLAIQCVQFPHPFSRKSVLVIC